MVERETNLIMRSFIIANWIGLYLWSQIYDVLAPRIMDFSLRCVLYILLNFPFINLALSRGIPVHAENHTLFTLGIYNSYDSSWNEIVTRQSVT